MRNYLKLLEERGELIRIKEEFDPCYEIGAAMRHIEDRMRKAPYFEKVKGYSMPVAGHLLSSRQRLALAFGIDFDVDVTEEFIRLTQNLIPPVTTADGPVLEITEKDVDILKIIPVLTHHEKDVSPYFSSAVTISRDPETGIRGMGIHRLQVKGPDRLGIFLTSPPLSEFFRKAEARKQDLPVAIVVGINPLTWFASVAWAPQGIDKYELAGALRKDPVQLVKAPITGIEVPAEAEFLIEGRVLAGVRELDGPFGESSGVYTSHNNPVIQVEAIYHRAKPVYHALLPYGHENAILIEVSWEAQNLKTLQASFPQVVEMHLDHDDWTKAIVQVKEMARIEANKLIEHILETYYYIKQLIVINDDLDIYDPRDIALALATRMQPANDVIIRHNLPSSPLDPSTEVTEGKDWYLGSKIGFNATIPGKDKDKSKFGKVDFTAEIKAGVLRKLAI